MEMNDIKFRDLLRDTAVLSKLEDEKEQNFQYITGQINARKRRRIFTRVALSCAAAVAVALAFTFSLEDSACAEDELDTLDSPLLITESGEKIALSDQNSYKLELGSQSNSALYSDLSNSNFNKSPKSVTSSNTKEKDQLSGQNVKTVNRNTVVIPRGFTYDIEFDDGSQAHLNSGSYIEFPKSFENRQERVVALTGEGYFKVVKSQKPFIVKVGGLDIRVYGTEFNVNTNKDGRVETLLVSGSVGVKSAEAEDGDEIVLKPNELLEYDVNTGSSMVKEVIVDDYLAWMKGDFTCSSQPLFHLIDEVSAFYGITINKDAELSNQLITISLSRQLGYRQIMEILSQAFGLEFKKVDSQTYICKQTN